MIFLAKYILGVTTDAGNPCDVFLPGGEYYDNNCFLSVAEPMTLHDATVTYFASLSFFD
ncbi:hypothetical protein RRG08_051158 [Elysia crispata]|uniref:Uncharacterized protein n=1 Tax=Elysia crispata TaxID=231223 RepID=A0AAE0YMH1_9GAST|nr:hypothetical protein RRG08_051158 [Elysia crispata]